jgi:cytochrome P450
MSMVSPRIRDELDRALASTECARDPYPIYGRLRAEDPIHWSEVLGGWVLTRYDDVLSTLRAPGAYSSSGRFVTALAHLPTGVRTQLRPLEDHFSVGLISADPPDHSRLRKLVNLAFTPRAADALRPRIQALVDDLLDVAQERGELDIIRDLAYPLPATVIAEMMGVPTHDRDQFKRWSDGIVSFQGTGRVPPETFESGQADLLAMRAYFGLLLAEHRKVPRDDLLSQLVAAEAAGDRLSEAELLTLCVNLLTAGHETTMNLIGSGLYTLLRHPEQLGRLRDEPGLMSGAVEEVLRYESPLQRNLRRVVEEVELGGTVLRGGDLLVQLFGAANRDPAQFGDPERFDITRQPNRHISFGYGIHFCVGAPLARLEAPVAIGTVLHRFPRLALATDTVKWRPRWPMRSLEALPVTV